MTTALTKAEEKIKKVSDVLMVAGMEIKDTIPNFLTTERLANVFISQCRKTPKLLECDAISLVNAFKDAGDIGLEPDGINAHLIPYGKNVTYMVDYKGMIKLARLSGEIADMTANVVYSEDKFEHEYGSNKHLKHIKTMRKKRGVRVGAYSYVKYKDGSEDFRVLTEDEVMHAKKSSKTGNIWASDPDPMWAKTAVRQHSKFLPKATALQKAVQYAEQTELKDVTIGEVMTDVTTDTKKELKDKIADKQIEAPKHETLEEGDFRTDFFKFLRENKCEDRQAEALADLGFESLEDVKDKNEEDMVMTYLKDNFTK